MFSSILIANRGEIAVRIMQTAKKLGLRTIAVYSEADANAMHVREADEAVCVGPAESAKSYLDQNAILKAALDTGAEAIHPGYGFLSENPEFAQKCADNDIIFVGPKPESMRQMALKDQAKKLMEAAGVPVTPGYHGADQAPATLQAQAARIGYPVLIKAVAGGGGRGMRKVDRDEDFAEQLASAQREARSAFGNDQVLIEKFIQNPRHIEVQVFGDCHGQAVHFFERDCSVQRRHQKVIEEAPAPGMTDEFRAAICGAAVRAAQAVKYENAGTVEFIVDGSGPLDPEKFWFMEINTRLQVEHPVTEMITGRDLVELQLRVAAGEALPKQDEITLSGHAMEIRLYAEQPEKGFLPSTGILEMFNIGSDDDVRVDTGFEEGDEVVSFYDPMLAKIITHEPTREDAIDAMAVELKLMEVWPVQTNAAFLVQVLEADEFAKGMHDTGMLGREMDALVARMATPMDVAGMLAETALERADDMGGSGPWESGDGWRMNAPICITERVQVAGETFDLSASEDAVRVNGEAVPAGLVGDFFHLGESFGLHLPASRGQQLLFHDGKAWEYGPVDAESAAEALEVSDNILAPMPGKVLQVQVKAGDTVAQGDVLVVMEAMKMEHALRAPRDGEVAIVNVTPGGQVKEADVLAALTPVEA